MILDMSRYTFVKPKSGARHWEITPTDHDILSQFYSGRPWHCGDSTEGKKITTPAKSDQKKKWSVQTFLWTWQMTWWQWHQNGKKDCVPQKVTRKIAHKFEVTPFPHLLIPSKNEKRLNTKAMIKSVFPKLFRTFTQIKVAIISYYPQ